MVQQLSYNSFEVPTEFTINYKTVQHKNLISFCIPIPTNFIRIFAPHCVLVKFVQILPFQPFQPRKESAESSKFQTRALCGVGRIEIQRQLIVQKPSTSLIRACWYRRNSDDNENCTFISADDAFLFIIHDPATFSVCLKTTTATTRTRKCT